MVDENVKNSDKSLVVERVINCPIEKVFNAWIEPKALKRWFFPGNMSLPLAEVDARVGGKFKITMKNPEDAEENPGVEYTAFGTYQKVKPNEALVMTWAWVGPESHESLLSIFFKPVETGTKVTLFHDRFANKSERDHHNEGWIGCMDNFVNYFNNAVSTSNNEATEVAV